NRFDLLTGGSRTALPRHPTLRALIDWSYDLLQKSGQTLLQRLSVFAGGCTLEAAEGVCCGGDSDPGGVLGLLPSPVVKCRVLDLLTSLVDKCLVVAEAQGAETRFGMLETVRHYAQDQLRGRGDEEPVRARHLGYLLDLGKHLAEVQDDDDRKGTLNRLDQEL